jgi:hypothetical protein
MRHLAGGLNPIMVYHGGIRKCDPIFVRRLACLTDKVERGDYTSTLSCTSPFHRYFGQLVKFYPPAMDLQGIEQYVAGQKSGEHDLTLKHFGWSCDYVDRSMNGGCFLYCYKCRMKTVNWLRAPKYGEQVEVECTLCGDWELNSRTKTMLSFPAPKDYPVSKLPNCPIAPPLGREVGLDTL